MALLGPDILPKGELQTPGQVYQKQLAATMASLLGDPVAPGHPPGKAIRLPAVPSSNTSIAVVAPADRRAGER
jgi:hypothetical protein